MKSDPADPAVVSYPPEQPAGWPPENITGLMRQMMSQGIPAVDYGSPSLNQTSFTDVVREIVSYVNPLAVKKIKTMDLHGPDFLVSKAMIILDILLGSETGSSEEEKITAGENLRMLVATKQADMLAVLIDLMQGETGAAHNITLALAIKRQLEAKHRRLPAKGEIKAQMLKVGCGLREDEPKGWERLWKDAGLKYLPKAKPQRGKSRHGQKKARKEEK